MNQTERRIYMIKALLQEREDFFQVPVPMDEEEQKRLLRGLMNLRMPMPVDEEFLEVQDRYLQEESRRRGIVRLESLRPVREGIYLWRGDITTLEVDAIVNAANSQMTGCYIPNHACIDNCIHTYSGIQLRLACADMMERQGFEEPVGRAKITEGYNLPAKYVIHTVGPTVQGELTEEDKGKLASCYASCLALAEEKQLKSIAFCCISTGVFHFPNEEAARIAVHSVDAYRKKSGSRMSVVFNVFLPKDEEIYRRLLKMESAAPGRADGKREADNR